ncbi:DUF4271 domain-containing protein [Mucilaginibacter auburnensis]|uniref:Uncharacterized protein DUF4271 n=1 Tax=Mucilaginibacter auburnensis TaxID=1457233 RepID=A0A2H9VNA7_9SPHI|nr:DUF4271 domain-containing protein [Mucilaginibacter auburnensis]PJJ79809.1 uncharacterized protein DUF4271 [Mucilaginibacter auburnensis]
MRVFIICLLLFFTVSTAFAQRDSVPRRRTFRSLIADTSALNVLDSVALAMQAKEKLAADSAAMQYVRAPDADAYVAEYLRQKLYHGNNFLDLKYISKGKFADGHIRHSRDRWIIIALLGLLLYTALLNLVWNAEIKQIFTSFYGKRSLSQVSGKEESTISAGAFIGLFVLFGLTFGLFLYQFANYKNIYYSLSGIGLFAWLSALIVILFAAKFVILKALGFIFDAANIVSEYISLLYLTYFTAAFVFLPVTICFSLLAAALIPVLMWVVFGVLAVVFALLYLRSSVNIISNIRFHKFYLFIYLCALEICPILILIKALKYNI